MVEEGAAEIDCVPAAAVEIVEVDSVEEELVGEDDDVDSIEEDCVSVLKVSVVELFELDVEEAMAVVLAVALAKVLVAFAFVAVPLATVALAVTYVPLAHIQLAKSPWKAWAMTVSGFTPSFWQPTWIVVTREFSSLQQSRVHVE